MLVQLPVQFLKSKRKIKIHTPRHLIRDVSAGFLFFIEEIMKPYHDALRMHHDVVSNFFNKEQEAHVLDDAVCVF